MAVLATAIDRTVNPAALHSNDGMIDVSLFVEEYALVALTGTEDIAGKRMGQNLLVGTWYANRTGCHGDAGCTGHVGGLVTAIDVGQDVSARNLYPRVTTDETCRAEIFCRSIRNSTAAAAKDVAIEGVSVRGYASSA